jgi:hypothetical protein
MTNPKAIDRVHPRAEPTLKMPKKRRANGRNKPAGARGHVSIYRTRRACACARARGGAMMTRAGAGLDVTSGSRVLGLCERPMAMARARADATVLVSDGDGE